MLNSTPNTSPTIKGPSVTRSGRPYRRRSKSVPDSYRSKDTEGKSNLIVEGKTLDSVILEYLNKSEENSVRVQELLIKLKTETCQYKRDLDNFKVNKVNKSRTSRVFKMTGNGTPDNNPNGNQSINSSFTHMHSVKDMFDVISKIPVFTGEPSSNLAAELHAFLALTKTYYSILAKDDQKIFLDLLPKLALKGNAYQIVKHSEFTNMEELETKLKTQFVPLKSLINLSTELENIRQLNGETAVQFGAKIITKLDECIIVIKQQYPNDNQALVTDYEKRAIHAFRRGLISPTLKQFSLTIHQTTVQKVISEVEKMEKLENETFSPPIALNPSIQIPRSLEPTPQYMGIQTNFSRQSNQQGNQATQYNRRGARPPIICYTCGKPNHTSRECRSRNTFCTYCKINGHEIQNCRRAANERSAQVHMNNVNMGRNQPRTCDFCLNVGHIISECYARERWESLHGGRSNQENNGNDTIMPMNNMNVGNQQVSGNATGATDDTPARPQV